MANSIDLILTAQGVRIELSLDMDFQLLIFEHSYKK